MVFIWKNSNQWGRIYLTWLYQMEVHSYFLNLFLSKLNKATWHCPPDRDAKRADITYLCYSFQDGAHFWTITCTDRNRNCEHCAVRPVFFTLWPKHRSASKVLLTIYEHNNLKILHHQLVINLASNITIHLVQSIQLMLSIIVMLLSLPNVTKYL